MSTSQYLRTNYRLSGGKIDAGELISNIVVISTGSTTPASGIVYDSMQGYGVPSRIMFFPISTAGVGISNGAGFQVFGPPSFSGSVWATTVFVMALGTFTRAFSVVQNIGLLAIIGSR